MRSNVLKQLYRLNCLVVLAAVLVSCTDRSYSAALSEGVDAYTSGNYSKAEVAFTKAFDRAQQHGSADDVVEVLGYLGRTFDEAGKVELAEGAFKRRIDIAQEKSLAPATRVETFLAIAIFYSKARRCEDLNRVLATLEGSDSPLKQADNYTDSVAIIADLSNLHCKRPAERSLQ